MGVCKCLGYFCAVVRKYLRLGNSPRTEIYFLRVWRAGSSESEGWWNQCSHEGCSLLSKRYLVAASSGAENSESSYSRRRKNKRGWMLCGASWMRAFILCMREEPSCLSKFLKASSLHTAIILTVTLFWRGPLQTIAQRYLYCSSCL